MAEGEICAVVRCPYCKIKHRFEPNYDEYRILYCNKCNRIFTIEPLRDIEPFTKDPRHNAIHRLNEDDINKLMLVAFDLGDLDYVRDLAERKKNMVDGWWVGDLEREDNLGYYDN